MTQIRSLAKPGIPRIAKLRVVVGAICSALILVGLLIQSGRKVAGTPVARTDDSSIRPLSVSPQADPAPITIEIDATTHVVDDPSALKTVCLALERASGVRPACLTNANRPDLTVHTVAPDRVDSTAHTDSPIPSAPDWFVWASLDSHFSHCSTTGNPKSVTAFAVHCDRGGAVCLTNQANSKTPYLLKIRLPKGLFRFERLAFIPLLANQAAAASCYAQLHQLEGSDNPEVSYVVKPGELLPGETDLVRFSDVARSARLELDNLKHELHNLAQSTPGPAARLKRITADCDRYSGGLYPGIKGTSSRRLASVHRLILVIAQAESLHRNYQSRHTVNTGPGASTMGALERLADSLSETSAVISGLVPQVEVTPPAAPVSSAVQLAPSSGQTVVTVSLLNAGMHSVDAVKLGLDSSELPPGSKCVPDDPAFFGSLSPGQSVRATFKVQLSGTQAIPPAQYVADVSYFASGAPAHLRPRPW